MMSRYMLLMFLAVIISSFSQVLLKVSTRKQYKSFVREYLNPWVMAGYGMMFVSTFLVLLAFRGMEYKNGPVIESTGYIFVMLLSNVFFKEKIDRRKLFGYALILSGVIVFYM